MVINVTTKNTLPASISLGFETPYLNNMAIIKQYKRKQIE
jgi:hypothetical protein